MNAQDIINFIHNAEKKTPVKVYYRAKTPVDFPNCHQFGDVVFGDWKDIEPVLKENQDNFLDVVIENDCRNSAVPLLDMKNIRARIEPGAIIRDQVEIGDNAVIMMGAIINIGAIIGEGTMIDMGAVLGGVVEPASATPVIIEDGVLVGANAVIIEGVHVGEGAVVAAGAIVIEDVPAHTVVAGTPARVIKQKDEQAAQKTALVSALRSL